MIGISLFEVVYIELPADESEGPYVTVSVYHYQVTYSDGDPYVSADGKVRNHGPGSIWSVRVLAQSNYGSSRISGVNPSRLEVGEIGLGQYPHTPDTPRPMIFNFAISGNIWIAITIGYLIVINTNCNIWAF
jgi:hypothetical protein